MRDLKRHTSKAILKAIAANIQESRKDWMLWLFGRAGKYNSNNEKYLPIAIGIWQQNNHPILLSTQEMLVQRVDYLHNNPVEAGIVNYPPDYVYSSAKDYYTEEKGFIACYIVSVKLKA